MYYTVIKHSGHLRTLEKCRKHSPAARVFYISLVFSNARRVLSQCNTRLRLLYLLNTWNSLSARQTAENIHSFKRFIRLNEWIFPEVCPALNEFHLCSSKELELSALLKSIQLNLNLYIYIKNWTPDIRFPAFSLARRIQVISSYTCTTKYGQWKHQ